MITNIGRSDSHVQFFRKEWCGNTVLTRLTMHIGVDDTLTLIGSMETTEVIIHDIGPAEKLLHGDEQRVFDDAGYHGIRKRDDHKHWDDVLWFIA